jgi:hypothetical protein
MNSLPSEPQPASRRGLWILCGGIALTLIGFF